MCFQYLVLHACVLCVSLCFSLFRVFLCTCVPSALCVFRCIQMYCKIQSKDNNNALQVNIV